MPRIVTMSGRIFDLTSFTEDDIDIYDIAHALANKARFNGHTEVFYSVAEHCIFCAEQMPSDSTRRERLTALLHDAPEAYLGDVIGPLKSIMPDAFFEIEDRIHRVVSKKFKLIYPIPDMVHMVDSFARAVEAAHLMPWSYFQVEGGSPSAYSAIRLPRRASPKDEFLTIFNGLRAS